MAAGTIGTMLFLGGCATDGTPAKDSHPFAKNDVRGDESVQRQAKADSFPTAQEAGLLPSE